LWTLLRPRVERVHLGNGVERIVLIAKRQRRVRHRQLTREDQTAHRSGRPGVSASEESLSQSTGELVDTLVNRLGEARVLRPVPQDSHLPERVAAYEQVVSRGDQASRRERERLFQNQAKQLRASAPFWSIPPRPSVLFETPHLVQVMAMVPDRPPSRMTWQGSELTMIRGIGPERLAEEWWQTRGADGASTHDSVSARRRLSAGAVGNLTNQQLVRAVVVPAPASTIYRDYYRVQDTSGRWFWVYRESESTRWYLQGIWA
jgi:protein ImuB